MTFTLRDVPATADLGLGLTFYRTRAERVFDREGYIGYVERSPKPERRDDVLRVYVNQTDARLTLYNAAQDNAWSRTVDALPLLEQITLCAIAAERECTDYGK